MTRTLFIHGGPPKTGTSAVQSLLSGGASDTLLYPQTGQWPDGAHHKVMFALKGRSNWGPITVPPWKELEKPFFEELNSSDRDTLISAESLDLDLLPTFLEKIDQGMVRPFDKTVVLLVLRHPLERAASAYNQNIKDLSVTERRMPKKYLEEQGTSFLLTPFVKSWQSQPVQVRFVNYHPSDTLVTRFMDTIGHAPPDPGTANARRNISISGYALVALLCGHRIGLTPDQMAQLFTALREDKTHSIWKGPSFPFAPQSCETFIADHAQADIEAVKALTGLDIPHPTRKKICSRFRLSADQTGAIMAHFARFNLDAAPLNVVERTVATFST